MTQCKLILSSIVIASALVSAANATEHYVITADCVAAAISRAGVEVSPDQIAFLAGAVATKPAPALKLRSAEKLDNDRLLARMECVNDQECLPFFVHVQAGQGNEAQIAAISRAVSSSRTAIQPGAGPVVVHSGSRVTLMLDGDHVHIRMAAICLQSGAPGQLIRVSDANRRLIYPAQVIDASAVKGRLQ